MSQQERRSQRCQLGRVAAAYITQHLGTCNYFTRTRKIHCIAVNGRLDRILYMLNPKLNTDRSCPEQRLAQLSISYCPYSNPDPHTQSACNLTRETRLRELREISAHRCLPPCSNRGSRQTQLLLASDEKCLATAISVATKPGFLTLRQRRLYWCMVSIQIPLSALP